LLVELFGVERHADTYTRIVLDRAAPPLLLVRVFLFVATIRLALDNQASVASRDEFFEDGGEFPRDLLEGALNSLVLAPVEMLD
jgi:hypothetical protein